MFKLILIGTRKLVLLLKVVEPKVGMSSCQWENCNEIATAPKVLYEHIQSCHIGYKRQGTLTNECKWVDCSFSCDRRDRMRSHVLCHIDCKLFECNSCSKSYKWKHDLYAHQRKAHNKDQSSRPRRKSLQYVNEQPFYLPSQDRRNTVSNLDFNELNIARQNVANQMCNPDAFFLSPSTDSPFETNNISPLPSRRQSFSYVPQLQMPIPIRKTSADSGNHLNMIMPQPPMQTPISPLPKQNQKGTTENNPPSVSPLPYDYNNPQSNQNQSRLSQGSNQHPITNANMSEFSQQKFQHDVPLMPQQFYDHPVYYTSQSSLV